MNISYGAFPETGRSTSLAVALSLLPSGAVTTSSGVAVTLPIPGQIRVRRIVHRGAQRPVTKVPSITLGRIVHCESVLEAELASILDACPAVVRFAEQAAVLHYLHNGSPKWHIPDFVVETDHAREFIEVKFSYDVNEDVLDRTTLLAELLRPYRIGYRLITEVEIRAGWALVNARKLLVRGRAAPTPEWALLAGETIRRNGVLPLSHFGWALAGSVEGAGIARQIIDGYLHVDMSREITSTTLVRRGPTTNLESQLWQPAASK